MMMFFFGEILCGASAADVSSLVSARRRRKRAFFSLAPFDSSTRPALPQKKDTFYLRALRARQQPIGVFGKSIYLRLQVLKSS